MEATLYVIKTADAYRFGGEPVVRLWEPGSVDRTWIRKLTVSLPDGFYAAESIYGEPLIYRGGDCYELTTDVKGDPVIIDHTNNGAYIHMTVLGEGW